MTLILAVGNPDHAIIVADRRVLVDGVRVENGANDPALLLPRDTRLAAVFTGMARSGQLDTQHWLLLALHASLQPGGTLSFEQLCLLADTRWTTIGDKDKRLTLVLAGHVTENGERYPALGIVSNWELPPDMDEEKEIDDRFRSVWWRHTEARNFAESFAVPAGMIEAITHEEILELKALAADGAAPDRIVERCVEIIREASGRDEAEDEVGTDCVSIVLSASPDADPVIRAHVSGGVTTLGKPSVVTPDSIVTDHEVVRAGESGLLAREKVGRNSACPCGNGKKYKHCHGA